MKTRGVPSRTMTKADMAGLRRKICDALELAIAAGAPWDIIQPLGTATGLLEALADVPRHEFVVTIMQNARQALNAWGVWDAKDRRKAKA